MNNLEVVTRTSNTEIYTGWRSREVRSIYPVRHRRFLTCLSQRRRTRNFAGGARVPSSTVNGSRAHEKGKKVCANMKIQVQYRDDEADSNRCKIGLLLRLAAP